MQGSGSSLTLLTVLPSALSCAKFLLPPPQSDLLWSLPSPLREAQTTGMGWSTHTIPMARTKAAPRGSEPPQHGVPPFFRALSTPRAPPAPLAPTGGCANPPTHKHYPLQGRALSAKEEMSSSGWRLEQSTAGEGHPRSTGTATGLPCFLPEAEPPRGLGGGGEAIIITAIAFRDCSPSLICPEISAADHTARFALIGSLE